MVSIEPTDAAPRLVVYDTCDEVRKRVRARMKKDGITEDTRQMRELAKTVSTITTVDAASLEAFLALKGAFEGAHGESAPTFVALYEWCEARDKESNAQPSKKRRVLEYLYANPPQKKEKKPTDGENQPARKKRKSEEGGAAPDSD